MFIDCYTTIKKRHIVLHGVSVFSHSKRFKKLVGMAPLDITKLGVST